MVFIAKIINILYTKISRLNLAKHKIKFYNGGYFMKTNNRKVFQAIQFAVFLGVSIFLFFRKVDGSGAENTSDVKWISFAVWLGFYLFALALEYGIRFLAAIIKNRK